MKINFKKIGIEAEGDVEGTIKELLNNNEKDWKEKFDSKHNAKKEIMELKHKYKLEEQDRKKSRNVDLLAKLKKEEKINNMEKQEKQNKNRVKIVSIILFFIYGIFCIAGFKDEHIISSIISLIQMLFVLLSIFTSMEILNLFKNDYKIFLILSILCIIPWLAFAI